MRVILVNRDHSLWEGGDKIKIENTMKNLRILGIDANYTYDVHTDYKADLVHLFHVSYPHCYKCLLNVKRQNLPLVVSTVYSGELLPRYKQQQILDTVSCIVFLSQGELKYVSNRLVVDQSKVKIIPNGVSRIYDQKPSRGTYVLNVGRIYPQKNQLALGLACQYLGLRLICVGEIIDEEYAVQVCDTGAYLLPNILQSELVQIYQNAHILACISTHEVQPNCVLEGGLCGANIVLSNRSCSFTTGFPNIWTCEPTPSGIISALLQAWKAPKSDVLRNIFLTFTWQNVAESLKEVYEEILNGR